MEHSIASTDEFGYRNIEILKQWLEQHEKTCNKYTGWVMDFASAYGHVYILKLLFEYHEKIETPPKYTHRAMVWASENGHDKILKMWFEYHEKTDTPPCYNGYALDWASEEGHVKILKMWFEYHEKTNTYPKYSSYAMDEASENGHVEVLETWFEYHEKTGIPLLYTIDAMDWASYYGRIAVLKWWFRYHEKTGALLQYTDFALKKHHNKSEMATDVKTLWIRMHHQFGIELKYEPDVICDNENCECIGNIDLMKKCIRSLQTWMPCNHHCFDDDEKIAIATMMTIGVIPESLIYYLPNELKFEIFQKVVY